VSTRARAKVCGLVVLGTLLLQAAWILVMPPFAGMDEFDHAFRASGVGAGQFRSDLGPAANGRGDLVSVDDDIAAAAQTVCQSYDYVGQDNCTPVFVEGGGRVRMRSTRLRITSLLDGPPGCSRATRPCTPCVP
jgi:hypothetical protein